jgi:GNAT superfamily N-acetyltransferase
MNLFWASFLRHAAQHSNAGSIRQLDGVEAAWVHSELIINNGTYLTSPAASEAELRTRFATASEDASPHKLPWIFYLYEPYMASLPGEQVASIAAEFKLARMMGMQVMTGDVRALQPPARPLPNIEFQRIKERRDAWIAFDLNLRAYGMPVFMAESVLDTKAYFSDSQREFGFNAFVGGVPVSTATVIELDGWLYVALVATDPDHRQKGYAEAVMRHALSAAASELQMSRTTLDASLMGAPLYLQMGYQFTGESWSMYAAA